MTRISIPCRFSSVSSSINGDTESSWVSSLLIFFVSKNADLSLEFTRKVMSAISEQCKKAPIVDGKPQGMKVQNIFVSSNWVEKIQKYK